MADDQQSWLGALFQAANPFSNLGPPSTLFPYSAHKAEEFLNTARIPGDTYQAGTQGNIPTPEQMIPDALKMSGLAATGGLAGAPAREGLGMFGGKIGSQNAARAGHYEPIENYVKFIRGHEDPNVEPNALYQKTGWFTGPDAQPRFEFSDAEAKMGPKYKEAVKNGYFSEGGNDLPDYELKDILEHPELYKHYPDIGETSVFGSTGLGQYDPDLDMIGINPTQILQHQQMAIQQGKPWEQYNPLSILLHEVQHAIQDRENFARGSNPAHWTPQPSEPMNRLHDLSNEADFELAKVYENELKPQFGPDLPTHGDFRDIYYDRAEGTDIGAFNEALLKNVERKSPYYHNLQTELANSQVLLNKRFQADRAQAFKDYQKTYGEAEARATQERMDMTPEERRATPPWAGPTMREAYPGGTIEEKYLLGLLKQGM